mmetsp:Transcript_53658/g.153053  ORF Transcript_53658/g.153053 Transcript_53658/m.153053 type:complete len:241 (+) Transcript_53658:226-948(+)
MRRPGVVPRLPNAIRQWRVAHRVQSRGPLPGRLRLGDGHCRLPDRGRLPRRRPRSVHLGHLHRREYRRDARRQLQLLLPEGPVHAPRADGRPGRHRERCLRPLPPVEGGRGTHEIHGPEALPLQHLLAAHFPDRRLQWRAQPRGFGLLQRPHRRAAGGRHHSVRDALPLGPAPGPPGPAQGERLVGARPRYWRASRGDRGRVARLRRRLLLALRRQGEGVGHVQRGLDFHVARLRLRQGT